ncbi:hypothetical protein, partial [Dermacoccus nishinomiyaensis]|uniref:hypothetical protein n=1 Tax=Dermacoccus nishinomiyaensis TaxID=1274 RepID=UPI001C930C30
EEWGRAGEVVRVEGVREEEKGVVEVMMGEVGGGKKVGMRGLGRLECVEGGGGRGRGGRVGVGCWREWRVRGRRGMRGVRGVGGGGRGGGGADDGR